MVTKDKSGEKTEAAAELLPKKKLGDLLVEIGLITEENLHEALQEQQEHAGKLGQILVEKGFITKEVLHSFLGKQIGVPYVTLSEYGEIPDAVIRTVPEMVARRKNLIPIALEKNTLKIAMANPKDFQAIDDLRSITGKIIKPLLADNDDIKQRIDAYYSKQSDIKSEGKTAKARATSESVSSILAGSMADIVREMDKTKPAEEAEEPAGKEKEKEKVVDLMALAAHGEDAPVIKMVNYILASAVKAAASDIHIEPFEEDLRVRFRIDGILHPQPAPPKKVQNSVTSRVKIMANLDIAEHRLPQDGRMKVKIGEKNIDLRVSTLPSSFGEKIVMRILDSSSLCLDLTKLGFDEGPLEIYKKNISIPYGIILVTGPTGSGKSTTLYSTLSTINHPDVNIITIEDPVEYTLAGVTQVQARADIGLTFAVGLRSFLRQDPDIIMVGEIRDTETAEIAINAALTGHLVFSTLHTNDAPGAVTRLTNMGIEPFLTSSSVAMVIAQRLVRIICENCKEAYEVPASSLEALGLTRKDIGNKNKVTLYRGKGCDHCVNTGYRGRLACYEVMAIDEKIRDLILQRAPTNEVKQAARAAGMITMREASLKKVLAGKTTVEEMFRVTFADEA